MSAKGDKFDSGASKRKRKKAEQKLVSSMSGSLLRHFTSIPSDQSNSEDCVVRSYLISIMSYVLRSVHHSV